MISEHRYREMQTASKADTSRDAMTRKWGRPPGKVIAIHQRLLQRSGEHDRTTPRRSYLLKPSSSLTGSNTVVRPAGTEHLAFRGQLAIAMSTIARNVAPEAAWDYVGWVTAATDFETFDDERGLQLPTLEASGRDGYTPLGPDLIDAAIVDPRHLRMRTWMDGELLEDHRTTDWQYGLRHLIADLSQILTLEPGDVVLTGNSGVARATPGNRIHVEVNSTIDTTLSSGRLCTEVGTVMSPIGPTLTSC